ncbi:CLUMA_CG013580, isoform A [Clunio marinus]|uniref:CLUMA_CG013580, isoform A n=1 Tax=Clunio marinus TaxID=568069 RepID=A0A1J1IJA3_9DIPT|nr:CLUMA_CG013580, isoform A [Clunio marinus]
MEEPSELSIREIHAYFLKNNCKVTNTQLVKYFRKFLTGSQIKKRKLNHQNINSSIFVLLKYSTDCNDRNLNEFRCKKPLVALFAVFVILKYIYLLINTNNNCVLNFHKIDEARKQFKTYVNVLATIKSEGNEKYLILRKKYYNELPSDDYMSDASACMSPVSMMSMSSDFGDSPSRIPPPYRQPPQFPTTPPINQSVPPSMTTVGLPIVEPQAKVQYKECVNEFQQVMSNFLDQNRVDVTSRKNSFEQIIEDQTPPSLPPRKRSSVDHRSISRENSVEHSIKDDNNKENCQVFDSVPALPTETDENKISVKEAMMKFNRYASEEEAKIPSPLSKANKKTEKILPTTLQTLPE